MIKLLPSRGSRAVHEAGKADTAPCSVADAEGDLAEAIKSAEAATTAIAAAQARLDLLRGQTDSDIETSVDDERQYLGEPTLDSAGIDTRGLTRGGRRRWLVITCWATVIPLFGAMGAACGYMAWHHHQIAGDRQSTAEFLAAARQGVVTMMSMNYQSVDKDIQRVIDSSTGGFHDDFEHRRKDFANVVEQSKVTTTAKVNAAALQSKTSDSATVMVAATTEITNAQGARQDPRNWRLLVTVKRDGGQLKMSQVEFVP